jgi:hypothetical protein
VTPLLFRIMHHQTKKQASKHTAHQIRKLGISTREIMRDAGEEKMDSVTVLGLCLSALYARKYFVVRFRRVQRVSRPESRVQLDACF